MSSGRKDDVAVAAVAVERCVRCVLVRSTNGIVVVCAVVDLLFQRWRLLEGLTVMFAMMDCCKGIRRL